MSYKDINTLSAIEDSLLEEQSAVYNTSQELLSIIASFLDFNERTDFYKHFSNIKNKDYNSLNNDGEDEESSYSVPMSINVEINSIIAEPIKEATRDFARRELANI